VCVGVWAGVRTRVYVHVGGWVCGGTGVN
jgi:hypothetical protein